MKEKASRISEIFKNPEILSVVKKAILCLKLKILCRGRLRKINQEGDGQVGACEISEEKKMKLAAAFDLKLRKMVSLRDKPFHEDEVLSCFISIRKLISAIEKLDAVFAFEKTEELRSELQKRNDPNIRWDDRGTLTYLLRCAD